MNLSSSHRPTDLVADLDQKALLHLAVDQNDPAAPRSYRLPSIDELAALFPDLEILELLGTGGMGCVFKARQKKLDRLVALKILPRELARDDLFAERFSREARAMARLNHPNIVAIHDFGQAGDVYYLAMEYMDGMNLRELIEVNAIDPHEALGVFEQVGNALAFAHGEGVVHRDIKPENILFSKQGHIALADFGLARLAMDSSCEISLTQTRQAMGTLNYMAPEQYEDPKSVDHRADIYAMGVLLYELMTGKVPRGSFPPVSSICPTGPRVDHVIERCLQVAPEDRYADVDALLAGLTGYSQVTPAGDNGTFTNFKALAATPFRVVKKLSEPPREDRPRPYWRPPLDILSFAAAAIALVTLMSPWSNDMHSTAFAQAALFTEGELGIPLMFVVPLLVLLGYINRFRGLMHPVRWFVSVFAILLVCNTAPFSIRRANGFYVAYVWTIGLLTAEHVFALLRDGWCRIRAHRRAMAELKARR